MSTVSQLFLAPLAEPFFVKSLLGGCLVAVVSGVVGCLVVLRRMAFLGDALSHAMVAGVAGGYLFMKMVFGIEAHASGMLLGSLIAAVLTVVLIGFVSKVSRVKNDTAIGIMYTGIFAGGVVLVSIFRNYIHIDLMHFIMGDVLAVGDADLWASAITSALVLSVILLFYRHLQLTSFDPVMAASIGIPVMLVDYLLTTCVSLVVVSAVSMVGVILVVGLLITPAATAYLLSDRLDRMMLLSGLFGITSVVGGLYLCVWLDSAGGGAIMLFCTLQFLVVLVAAPRYGMLARWLRLRRMAPQQLLEDILITMLRANGSPLSQVVLKDRVEPAGNLNRALTVLVQQGSIRREDNAVLLTDTGRREAQRLLRAHRLWESYLDHVGTPAEDLHSRAHELEHVHDSGVMAYLDDLLEHPVRDPHGKEIPQAAEACEPDAVLPVSLLRAGQLCEVYAVSEDAAGLGLMPGEELAMLPRSEDGKTWRIRRADGGELDLDHTQADSLKVRCRGLSQG